MSQADLQPTSSIAARQEIVTAWQKGNGKLMDIETLRTTPTPDTLSSEHLQALWYDLHDDWDTAHGIVQRMTDVYAMWIHAYLHRKEPDIWNAKYWYRHAGKPFPGDLDFDAEAASILTQLVN